jgi:RimJ/RimL family protein N-acetyltransferase
MTGLLSMRPSVATDSGLIHAWRNSERVRLVSGTSDRIDIDRHEKWFSGVLKSPTEELLIVEWNSLPVAVIRMEHEDFVQETSSWGCYLGDNPVPLGLGGVLPYLGLSYGFETRNLRRMYSSVLSSNSNMLRIHKRIGLEPEGIQREHIRRPDGGLVDVVDFGVLRKEWPSIKLRFDSLLPTSLKNAVRDFSSGEEVS